jgi:hypothetical protein
MAKSLPYIAQYLKQTPLPADWNRFEIVATRVRDLIHDPRRLKSNYPTIDLEFFRCLKAHGKRIHNLRSLQWTEPDADIFPHVTLFLGPHLVQLELCLPIEPAPGAFNFFSSIKNISPDIGTLHLTRFPYSQVPIPQPSQFLILSSLVCSFPRLTSINMRFPATAEAIKHLSTLPELSSLCITNDTAEILRTVADTGSQQPFACLRVLYLPEAWPALCFEFLKLIQPVHLRILSVHFGPTYMIQTHDIRQFFVGLRELCSHSQLETVAVGFGSNLANESPPPDVLEPLYAFKNLHTLIFESSLSDFDNASLKRLAITWPKLSRLDIYARPDGNDRSKVCLEGLAELVARCPDLTMLTIDLHISANNLQHWKKTHEGLCNDILWFLDLRRSTFDCDASELASLLHTLFPNLNNINYFGGELGAERSWADVARRLELYRRSVEE